MQLDRREARTGLELRDAESVRLFYVTGASMALLAAVVFWLFQTPGTAPTYRFLTWGSVAVAGVFALGGWWARNAPLAWAALVADWSAVALICVISLGLGEGVHAVSLGFFSVLICVATVVASVRAGVTMAVFCGLWLAGLAAAEVAGWVPGAAAVAASPFYMRVITLLMMTSTSFAIGQVVARLVDGHLAQVRERERRYRTLFEQSPAGLLLHADGVLLDANRVAVALFGLPSPVSALTVDALPDDLRARMLRAVLAQAATLDAAPVGTARAREELHFPVRSRAARAPEDAATGAGDDRVLQVSAVRVEGERGVVTLSIVFDDSERHAAEAATARMQAQLGNLVAASPDCIMLTRVEDGMVVLVNERFAALTGMTAAEAIGSTVADLGLWADDADRLRFRAELLATGMVRGMLGTFVLQDGEQREFALSANSFVFDGVAYLVTLARDVTLNERARREQQAILDTASLGIGLVRNRVITRVNGASEAIFGYPPGTMVGMHTLALWARPEEVGPLFERWEPTLRRGELADLECEMRRADGSVFWCRLRGRAVDPTQPQQGGLVWVFEDVTERRQMERALEAARDAAEAASRAKSAFLANTSHEIRTPLNGLQGLTRLALRPDTDVATRQRYLRQILDSAHSLADVMGGILDMSRIEAGQLALDEAPFDLHALCAQVHGTYAAVAEGRGLHCTLDIAADVPRVVLGDALRTRQILGNYITNALKFTPRGGIRIRLRRASGERVRLEVEDTGIGIDAASLARLFKPFAQAQESTTRRFGGTGLGLSICREFAALMGGEVGADSTEGRGSTFWAELPVPATRAAQAPLGLAPATAAARTPAAATVDHAVHVGPPRAGVPTVAGSVVSTQSSTPAPAHDAFAGLRVLLAEDNPVNRIIAATLLQDWGMHVVEAPDGRAAVEAIDHAAGRGEAFDLVLMDVQMPALDGFAATRELRARYTAGVLPIVALTAGALASERDMALASGMNAFVTKPIDEPAFRRTLANVLAAATPARRSRWTAGDVPEGGMASLGITGAARAMPPAGHTGAGHAR